MTKIGQKLFSKTLERKIICYFPKISRIIKIFEFDDEIRTIQAYKSQGCLILTSRGLLYLNKKVIKNIDITVNGFYRNYVIFF